MPKYVCLLTGAGDGCDYTIACNKDWKIIEADTLSDLSRQIKELLDKYTEPEIADYEVLELAITPANTSSINSIVHEDVNRLYREAIAARDQTRQTDVEKQEREQLAKLKAKYEPPTSDTGTLIENSWESSAKVGGSKHDRRQD